VVLSNDTTHEHLEGGYKRAEGVVVCGVVGVVGVMESSWSAVMSVIVNVAAVSSLQGLRSCCGACQRSLTHMSSSYVDCYRREVMSQET